MQKLILITIAMLTAGLTYADQLIDDFEKGNTVNYLGGNWYYFSDVKDSGYSKIVNASLLNNGNYPSFIPDTGGYNSQKSAKLEFILSDSAPDVDIPISSFVGIGTDLKFNSGVVDIQSASGIKFKARGSQNMIIFVELVTSNIIDYLYFRAYFLVTPSWQEFKVNFHDTTTFMSPTYRYPTSLYKTNILDLSKVLKINWQVLGDNHSYYSNPNHPSSLSYEWANVNKKQGCLYLDDVSIVGISSTSTVINYPLIHQRNQPFTMTGAADLLGRRLPIVDCIKKASGIYMLSNIQKNQMLVISQKK